MKIGLLIIGNEILEGKINDANTRQLSLFLKEKHLELKSTYTVKDDPEAIHQGLATLFDECNVVVTSGGLGPTKDDITKESIASFLGRKIQFAQSSLEVAEKNYLRFNRVFAGKDHGYSFLPEGFLALENSTGFAPGLFTEHQGKYLLCGPGVPREFKSLLEDHFVSLLKPHFSFSNELIESVTVKTKRVPEEQIFGEVDPSLWDKLAVFGTVSSLPNVLGVDIGVKIRAKTKEELESNKKKVLEIFNHSPIKKSIWQIGNQTLEEFVVRMANQKKITYSFAESCTGGLCSNRITNISGSSETFLGSIISYAESVKENLLQVKSESLKKYGAVSTQVAKEMSKGLSQKIAAQICISITGFAGPGGGTNEVPVGTACFGVTRNGETTTHSIQYPGDRELLKMRFSQMALFLLLEELEKTT